MCFGKVCCSVDCLGIGFGLMLWVWLEVVYASKALAGVGRVGVRLPASGGILRVHFCFFAGFGCCLFLMGACCGSIELRVERSVDSHC